MRKHFRRRIVYKTENRKNERYNFEDEIKISENISHKSSSNNQKRKFEIDDNFITEERELSRNSNIFETNPNEMSENGIVNNQSNYDNYNEEDEIFFFQNRSSVEQHPTLKKPPTLHHCHFSTESQLINFNQNLYEDAINQEQSRSSMQNVTNFP